MCYNFSMNYAKVKSYAKINLCLDIKGVAGGFHDIESVVATVDLYDVIAVSKRKKDKLVGITMHGMGSESIAFENNNAVKAAQAFIDKYSTCGVDITVWKNIPIGAGLGGSSADISGVLRAMRNLFGVDDEEGLKSLADSLGSDCGYMLYGGYALISGRGEKVDFIQSPLDLDIGVALAEGGVSTAQCYSLYDGMGLACPSAAAEIVKALEGGDKPLLGGLLSNGLYVPACALNAAIAENFAKLKDFDPLGVCMTGSGSAVYALFENDSFARYAQSRYRGGKFILTKTKSPVREDKNGGRKAY